MHPTIFAYLYPVVLVPQQHRKSVTGIVHTSRTIQTRNQAGIVDYAVIEVSCVAGCTVWLYSLGCFWLYNRCMCTYSGGSTQDPTTNRSRHRSHLSDRSTAYDKQKMITGRKSEISRLIPKLDRCSSILCILISISKHIGAYNWTTGTLLTYYIKLFTN